MDKFLIDGGVRLSGTVRASGAKNAALPIVVAGLLTQENLVLNNVPDLADIKTTLKLLAQHGVNIENNLSDKNQVILSAPSITSIRAPYELVRTMRASILVLGPLLARMNEAEVSLPGGCAIGARPVDLHLRALQQMGAEIRVENGYVHAKTRRLHGARIVFDMVSVGATENLMMAASLANGTTVLENAAREPEIVDLADCLRAMGAKITGDGTSVITIEGVEKLHAATHSVQPDRIEIGTFLVGAVMTRGQVRVEGADPSHQDAVFAKLREAGARIECGQDWINIEMTHRPLAVDIRTAPYPAFATDMQAQLMAMNCIADGVSTVRETIFENRFMHAPELQRLGADIRIEGNTAIIVGKNGLNAAPVMATDLRASASLVLAALVANGQTEMDRIYHIDRGYEKIEQKFAQLGANISRISG